MDNKTKQTLVDHFSEIRDPRIERRKLHALRDIIVIAICASVADCDGYEEIAMFAEAHEDWFKKFLTLENGIPSHDTFERVFARINAKEFRRCFANWTRELAGIFTDVIAIDGQTHRGARRTGESKSSLHMVSAWATGLKLVLAQEKVADKSNEITAIPEVLKMLEIKGCIITIDAMGCQQKIAQQIIDQSGDYILGLKENQKNTLEAVTEHFSTINETQLKKFVENDKGHGRVETREHFTANAQDVIDLKEWPGLKSVVKVVSTREIGAKKTTENRFYLSSIPSTEIEKISNAIRSHWGIENSLHYVLDVTFDQDKSRIRNDFGPENTAVLRHFAMNILKFAPNAMKSNPSKNLKRKKAMMNTAYLEEVMRSAGLAASGI